MHKRWQNVVVVFVLGLVVPSLMLARLSGKNNDEPLQTEPLVETELTLMSEQTEKTSILIGVLREDGSVENMDLEDYVTGVVLAEMPASFETEALKAQAVVARTYSLRRLEGNYKHPEATVCTQPSCCQGYRSESAYLSTAGTALDVEKVRRAVKDTEGMVLVYQGELIEATYFSCSGGITEDAAAVWGEDVPYLRSTLSPGEEHAANYVDTVYLTTEEFEDYLGVELPGSPANWIGNITYTAGKGVDTIEIGGMGYEGTWLRSVLGLRSTAFSITVIANTVVITTKGYGHRVGMSQYGADAMALDGSTYSQILAHYYQNTELVKYGMDGS